MTEEAAMLELAARCARRGDPFVLATVISTEGSSPRDSGAKLLWNPERGLCGTVGGGQFESFVIESARAHFEQKSAGVERFTLGAEAGQCCGGKMEVFYEYVGARSRLVIFGAGHVAQALTRTLSAAPLEIAIVDDRPDWNSAERFPDCRHVLDYAEGAAFACESPETTLTCVMTYSHDIDFDILVDVLKRPEPPAFVGLIGSKSKWACFRTRLASEGGLGQDSIERVQCPIGLGNMGKAPELVAVSIAGQILLEVKSLSVKAPASA